MHESEKLDIELQKQCLEREKLEFEETKKAYAFQEEEREFSRKDWKNIQHREEQEITRRGIETCISVLRTADGKAIFNLPSEDTDAGTLEEAKNVRKLAWDKMADLIPKLG